MRNYYEDLEVSPNATPETIRAAYKALSQRYHPDRNPEFAQRAKDITEAHRELSDPARRAKHDADLAAEQRRREERAAGEAARRAAAAEEWQRQEREVARRRAAEEAARRAAAAEEWRRQAEDEEIRQRAQAAARERELNEKLARERAATTASSKQPPPRYEPTKPTKRGGFMRGLGTFTLWGVALWIGATVYLANKESGPRRQPDSKMPAVASPSSSPATKMPAVASPSSSPATQIFTCRMRRMLGEVVGDLSVDFRASTVDGEPAQISEDTISYRDVTDNGVELGTSINRHTGVITTTSRDTSGRVSTYSGHCTSVVEGKF